MFGPAASTGATDPDTVVQVSFILRSPPLADLDKKVQAGWPGKFLTTSEFARRYGQSPLLIAAIEAYLHRFGIKTHAYADDLDISATGTAAEFDQALTISLQNFRVSTPSPTIGGSPHVKTVYGTKVDPRLPASIGNPILAILGLSNYSPFVSNAIKAQAVVADATPAAAHHGIPAGNGLAPQDFTDRYNLEPLESRGAQGKGQTIGIVTLASVDPSVPLAFWNQYLGLHEPASRLTLVPVDGGSGPVSADSGSIETDLDVEQSGAIASAAHIRVYEAPNTDPGFADAFFAAASDNVADTVSTSWGEAETVIRAGVAAGTETPEYAAVFDEVFAEMGAQGQSNFSAAGDAGAYDDSDELPTTNLDVDNPAASPYTTAAGGSTLPGTQRYAQLQKGKPTGLTVSVRIPAERAWSSDYLWPVIAVLDDAPLDAVATDLSSDSGGGGGYSLLESRPSYQIGISSYRARQFLTPTTPATVAPGLVLPTEFSFTPAPALTAGVRNTGRGVPDLAANADPQTGYAVYDPNLLDGGFAQFGGTSFVSPQLNGATAVINSYLGHRVGFWNPLIYRAAQGDNSPLAPLNSTKVYRGQQYLFQTSASGKVSGIAGEFSNDNLFYTGNPGTVWNPATGLGLPNLTALASKFAHR